MADKKTLAPTGLDKTLVANGSCNLSALLDAANKGHSAFVKLEDGRIFFNFNAWINAEGKEGFNGEPNMSLQLNSTQDMRKHEQAVYFGNGRTKEFGPSAGTGAPVAAGELNLEVTGDVTTAAERKTSLNGGAMSNQAEDLFSHDDNGDLPF